MSKAKETFIQQQQENQQAESGEIITVKAKPQKPQSNAEPLTIDDLTEFVRYIDRVKG